MKKINKKKINNYFFFFNYYIFNMEILHFYR